MKLSIYTSTYYKTSMEYVVKKAVQQAEKTQMHAYILVPETRSLEVEQMVVSQSKGGATMLVEVVTFRRLFEKLKTNNQAFLSKEAGIMLIRKLALEHINELVCFKKTAKSAGFAQTMYETITQLKSSHVGLQDAETCYQSVAPNLKIKMHDVFQMYAWYETYLQSKYIDASDKLYALSELILTSAKIKQSHVYIIGFENATAQLYTCIKSLIQTAKTTTVSCSYMAGTENAYITENEFFENIKHLGDSLHLAYTATRLPDVLAPEILAIQQHLYTYQPYVYPHAHHVTVGFASNEQEETMFLAQSIMQDVKMHGLRYHEIGVLCPAIEHYTHLLQSIFADYQIPVFMQQSSTLAEHPLFSYVESLFRLKQRNFDQEDVLLFSQNVLCNLSVTESSAFENYCLAYGVQHGEFLQPFTRGAMHKNGKPSAEYIVAEKVRQKLCAQHFAFVTSLPAKQSIAQWVQALQNFMQQQNVVGQLNEISAWQWANGEKEKSGITKQAYAHLQTLLETAKQIMGETVVTADECMSILLAGAQSQNINVLPQVQDSVLIGTVQQNWFGLKKLYVCGAVSGKFPLSQQDCGMIRDQELQVLSNAFAKKIEPTIKTVNARERFACFQALLSAGQALTVTCPKTLSGEEVQPSTIVLQLAEMFENIPNLLQHMQQNEQSMWCMLGNIKHATEQLVIAEQKKQKGEVVEQEGVYQTLKATLPQQPAIQNMQQNTMLQNAEHLYFPNKKTSITRLESYYACPFKCFAENGLRMQPRKEAVFEPMDIGDFLHAFAEKFVKAIQNKTYTPQQIQALAHSVTEQIAEQEVYATKADVLLLRALKSEAKRLAEALYTAQQNSNFRYAGEEVVFGEHATIPAVTLTNGISLEGKIDRIDTNGNLYRLVDYKTGQIDLSAYQLYYGKKIQLFMYLSAMKHFTAKQPVGAFYYPIRNYYLSSTEPQGVEQYRMQGYFIADIGYVRMMDTSLSLQNPKSAFIKASIKADKAHQASGEIELKEESHMVSAVTLQNLIAYAEHLSVQAVEEMRKGCITPSPLQVDKKLPCTYCPYRVTCALISGQRVHVRKANKQWNLEEIAAQIHETNTGTR